jgi:hypothetical protein
VVLERVSHTQEARLHSARSDNLPRQEARKALAEARQALAASEAAARAECASGRGPRCAALERREDAARQRVADARAKLTGLGAQTAENPAAAMLGSWAETFQLAMLLGLPAWLELAAPVVLAYGFAPAPKPARIPPAKTAAKKKRRPRKPPAPPAAKRHAAAPGLRLVASNDN